MNGRQTPEFRSLKCEIKDFDLQNSAFRPLQSISIKEILLNYIEIRVTAGNCLNPVALLIQMNHFDLQNPASMPLQSFSINQWQIYATKF